MDKNNFAVSFIDCLFANKKLVQYIQVGVNDAVNSDFIRERAVKFGWTGILIEPHPRYFSMAKEAYGESPLFAWENIAISTEEASRELYFVRDVPDEHKWALGIASFNKSHVESHLPWMKGHDVIIDAVNVECIKLSRIVDKYKFYNTDILIIDVEGFELNVIQSIDFTFFRPKLVVIETYHMSEKDFHRIKSYFPSSYQGVYIKGHPDGVIFDTDNIY